MSLASISLSQGPVGSDSVVLTATRNSVLRYVRHIFADAPPAPLPGLHHLEDKAVDEIDHLIQQAEDLSAAGALARSAFEEEKAEDCFRKAFNLTVDAANRIKGDDSNARRQDLLLRGVRYALDCGEANEARHLIERAGMSGSPPVAIEGWAQFQDENAWSDVWLIAAVRRDPPDEKALDILVDRYWKPLFGRCQILTLNHHEAGDLAQDAWCRVLRARHALKPGGNFPAYLTTIATNLWRDRQRSARRAGPLADQQLASLDAVFEADNGNASSLADMLPDLKNLEAEQKKLMMMDIDRALEQLPPLMRDVLVSRFLANESCAEIGRRYGRTEQSVNGWLRQAVQQMKNLLVESNRGTVPKGTHD